MGTIYQSNGQSLYDDGGKTYDAKSGAVVSNNVNPNAAWQAGGSLPGGANPTPAPAAPAAPAAPTDGSVPSPYYPRYTGDATANAADNYLNTFQAPKTAEELQQEKTTAAQGQIDSLNKYYDSLLSEQNVVNQGRDRGTNAISVLNGLSGSTDAQNAATTTSQLNAKDNEKIQNERSTALQSILSNIRTSAVQEAQQSRLEARQSAQDILANRKTRMEEANGQATNLAKSGVTLEGLKSTDPVSYQHLVSQAGGEQQLQSLFTLNRPQETILDKSVQNGKYVIAYQNPLTGKTRIESTDLGIPAGYSKSVDLGDKLMFYPDNFNPNDKNSAQPFYVNKGIDQLKQAQIAETYANIANKKVDTQLKAAQAAAFTNPNLLNGISNGMYDPTKINSRNVNLYNAMADAGVNAVQVSTDVAATKKVITNLDVQASQINQAGGALEKNMTYLASLSDKVNTLGIPKLDTDINALKSKYSNQPDVVNYLSTLATVRSEYAKYIARGGQVDDAVKREAAGAIPAGINGATLNSLHDTLKTEGDNVLQSIKDAKTGQWNSLQGGASSASGGGDYQAYLKAIGQ